MITSNQLHSIWIPQLETSQEADRLDREQASVYIVAQEQVIGVGRVATYTKNFNEVVELSVDVADYSHWRTDVDDVAFPHEQLFRLFTDLLEQRLS